MGGGGGGDPGFFTPHPLRIFGEFVYQPGRDPVRGPLVVGGDRRRLRGIGDPGRLGPRAGLSPGAIPGPYGPRFFQVVHGGGEGISGVGGY